MREDNPFEESLQVGQFVARTIDGLSEDTDIETVSRKICKQAMDKYLEQHCVNRFNDTTQKRLAFKDYNGCCW